MALYETLTVVDVLLGALALILGGLLVHFIAAVIVYGNPGFARRAGRRFLTEFEPDIQEASQRVVRGIWTSFSDAVEKDPEALAGLIDPFLPKAWDYFIHRFNLIKADIAEKAGEGLVDAGSGLGLGMLENLIPEQYKGLAQQFMPMIGGGASLPGGQSVSQAPAPSSGRVFRPG